MSWHNDQVSRAETEKILEIAKSALIVEGDFIEMGCYRGDTSLLLAEILQHSPQPHPTEPPSPQPSPTNPQAPHPKKLWLYDSFAGLPEKTTPDQSALGANFKPGALSVTKREVKARFLRSGLKTPIIKKAWFSELTGADLPPQIAFAFLDGDLYTSIKDSLKLVTPKLSRGGVIIVHDYNNPALPGVAKAVNEWLAANPRQIEQFQSLIIIQP